MYPMQICKCLRNCCLKSEVASFFFVFLGFSLFAATIATSIYFHTEIVLWLEEAILLNGSLLGSSMLVDGLLIYGLFSLSFSECTPEDENQRKIQSRDPFLGGDKMFQWVSKVGKNPARS
jgi:hypothetical protein